MIEYKIEKDISAEEFRMVLISSTLGERRPVNDPECLKKMIENANLIITARENGKLVGISRSLSDYSFCTYLSDLAVIVSHQKKGIGRELIRQTKLAAPMARLILLSAPAAIHFYPNIGMTRHDFCFFLDDLNKLI